MSSVSAAPQLSPKVIPGCSNTHSNSGLPTILSDLGTFAYQSACYGPQQLLACSSAVTNAGEVIFVYDMNSMLLTQSLSGHKAAVTALLWRRPPASYLQTGLFLWSGDASGALMYWDVVEGVALTSIQTPCHAAVQSLTLLTDEHLLVVTQEGTGYVFNSHLVDNAPLPPGRLLLEAKQSTLLGNISRPSLVACSRLNDQHCCAVVLGDRLRILTAIPLDSGAAAPVAKDLIYDSCDGAPTVIDVFFSDAQEEVLYFATRNTVGCYDWKLRLMLNESLLWLPDEVEFRRIFRSCSSGAAARTAESRSQESTASSSGDAAAAQVPLMYSFGSDQRLVAWHVTRHDRFTAVSTDVRGVRINAKLCVNVVQSELDSSLFAVLFEDGSIVHWQYSPLARRWRLLDCWLAPVVRPVTFCPVGAHHCCVALESGHLALMDITHSMAVRRFNLVYSGGTKIVLLCGYKWSDLVWIVSDRIQQYRHHHQVSLIDTRTGEVVRVLRKPSSAPEQTRMKEITMDPTTTYVLLTFWNGTFEVWTAADSRLVHIHSGLGVANVSWAPPLMRRCLSGVQGTPQLLAVLFSEGTLSLWSAYKDRVVVSRDAIPLFHPSAVEGSVRSAVVADTLVMWDGHGNGVVLRAQGTRLAVRRLRDAPPNSGAVMCLGGPSPPSRATEFMSFSSPLAWPSSGSLSYHEDGDNAASSISTGDAGLPSTPTAGFSAARAVAVLFESGVFAVWDIATGERRALSSVGMAADVRALSLYWTGGSLCVLGADGCLYVLDTYLTEMNSSVRYRALRRPMKNVAFLLPAHRTYVQVALELGSPQSGLGDQAQRASHSLSDAPSAVMEAVPSSVRPCRGPFGQLLTEDIRTLQDELELYRTTMVPRDVLLRLSRCGSTAAGAAPVSPLTWLRRAAVVADFLGQSTKQRFMRLAADVLRHWQPSAVARRGARGTPSPASSPADAALATALTDCPPASPDSEPLGEDSFSVPQTYACADAYSEALAPSHVVRRNRILLNEQRSAALLVNARNHRARDDSITRLALARDWLRLEHRQNVIEVLLDAPPQSTTYNELATLSMAVAASTAVQSSSADSATSALFAASAKRAAAMLLAQGDVEAAVEKLTLAGEYRSACVTLQSKGRWRDAVLLVKAAPQVQRPLLAEVLQRWSALSVKRGYRLLSAALLLAVGEANPYETQPPPLAALSLLIESAHFTDVAGVLALVLAQYHEAILGWPETAAAAWMSISPAHSSDTSPVQPVSAGAMMDTVLHALGDYSGLLHTVGNMAAEEVVLRQAAMLKVSMRQAAKDDSDECGD
ncbi:conserved hypothetical protein [Leishmania infantum JPCM5]|uniref:Uncharacterized protein n=2 Tax=Leishmania infantum TaxID=5671 RepID=A4IAE7_LEIIN|nr:conserved hypothetical protein [Leishmania infantum JPCM5]CAC9541148.1 hypothetical_protein_-_conserved [Leishmania infantum]CAM71804.1 conserved hypothetical protein [Leishmania infantum JPCM5]SUZ45759.1 hypothetical_protein_-_conserved [Leishmania infantum]|eukprot:XP_001468716.1 conserved hypothetical protein [Leishmania infantum JPCM5]